MANPFFSSAKKYPITLKPITDPADKKTHTDVFNILNTLRSLLRDMDTLFLGSTLSTAPPNDADWIDTGTGATVFQDDWEQSLTGVGTGPGTNIVLRTRPLTTPTPYQIRASVHCQHPAKDYLGSGIALRDSTSGAIITIGTIGNFLVVNKYSDPATLTSTEFFALFTAALPQYYKISNDGTDIKFFYSGDGVSWIQVHSEAVGSHDEAGFWISTENSATPDLNVVSRLFSWRVENE